MQLDILVRKYCDWLAILLRYIIFWRILSWCCNVQWSIIAVGIMWYRQCVKAGKFCKFSYRSLWHEDKEVPLHFNAQLLNSVLSFLKDIQWLWYFPDLLKLTLAISRFLNVYRLFCSLFKLKFCSSKHMSCYLLFL